MGGVQRARSVFVRSSIDYILWFYGSSSSRLRSQSSLVIDYWFGSSVMTTNLLEHRDNDDRWVTLVATARWAFSSTLLSVSMQRWPYPKLIGRQVAMAAPWYKSVTCFGSVSTQFIQPWAFGPRYINRVDTYTSVCNLYLYPMPKIA